MPTQRPALAIAAVMVTIFLLLVPFFRINVKHHPDERHYTVAAIHMVQTGDWLTPRTASGEVRLKKPILSYWLVAISYKLFGISVFSARLPFVLMGLGFLPLTYYLSWRLFGSSEVSWLAMIMVATNPALLITMCQSMPDILLSFSLLVATIGSTEVLLASQVRWRWLLLLYGGITFGILAKGVPALAFGIVATSFLVWHFHRQRKSAAPILVGMLAALVCSGTWFVAMLELHGQELVQQFYSDQVGIRITSRWSKPFVQGAVLFGLLTTSLFPWWSLIVDRTRKSQYTCSASRFLQTKPELALIGLWLIVFLTMSTLVSRANIRYQIVSVPLICVLLSGWIYQLDRGVIHQRFDSISKFMTVALLLVSSLAVFSGWVHGESMAAAVFCFFAVICCVAVSFFLKNDVKRQLLVTTFCVVMIFPLMAVASGRLTLPTVELAAADKIQSLNVESDELGFIGDPSQAARMIVALQGKKNVRWLGKHGESAASSQRHLPIIWFGSGTELSTETGFAVHEYGLLLGSADQNCLHDFKDAWYAKLGGRERNRFTLAIPSSRNQSSLKAATEEQEPRTTLSPPLHTYLPTPIDVLHR